MYIRFFHLILFLTTYSFSYAVKVGDTYMYGGQMYRVTGAIGSTCSSNQSYSTVTHVSAAQGKLNDSFHCNYGWQPIVYWGFELVSGDCQVDSKGLCYQELCAQDMIINGETYQANQITSLEECTTDINGDPTGNVWLSALECSSTHGSCMQKNDCPAPEGFSSFPVQDSSQCTVENLNALLPHSSGTMSVASEAMYQDCSSTCWVKSTNIDCSSKVPYTPLLEDNETIYGNNVDFNSCSQYASDNNLLYRHESHSDISSYGYSCWQTQHCIIRPMPRDCSSVTIPSSPILQDNETKYGDNTITESQCSTYANSIGYTSRYISHVDPGTPTCYNNNYCIIKPTISDNNTSDSDSDGALENNNTTDNNTGQSTLTDTNVTSNTNTTSNTSEYPDILNQIDSNIKNGNLDIKDAIDNIGSDITTSLTTSSDRNHEDLISINDSLNTANDTLTGISDYMQSGISNTDASDTLTNAQNQATSTINSITSSLNQIISNYTGVAPIVTGTGNNVFTASVYGSNIEFNLSKFENLKQYFDILWLLMLAYFNFKMYVLIIRDLLKKV